jgi:ribosome-associated protein
VKTRLAKIAGRLLTKDGEIVIRADSFRTQDRNRQDARDRLIAMIAQAAIPPKPRIKTRPTKASKERRLVAKATRSGVKKLRRGAPSDE